MTDNLPVGQRFSQVYLISPDLLPDSKRMRIRLAHLIGQTALNGFGYKVASELGLSIVIHESIYASYWVEFCQSAELRDVLDLVTLRYRTLAPDFYDSTGGVTKKLKKEFLADARRIFAEERVRYRIDDAGGVHFTVDAEFERSRISTLSDLGQPRYVGVRELFESSFLALDSAPPDGKVAVRSTFFAAESLFRLMYPSAHQLSAGEVLKHLKPQIDTIYEGQKPAIYVAQKQLSAFKEWIDGAHFYRHEPGTEDPAQPPLDLAIYMMAQGAAHIRWLAKIDARR